MLDSNKEPTILSMLRLSHETWSGNFALRGPYTIVAVFIPETLIYVKMVGSLLESNLDEIVLLTRKQQSFQ
jgi:hypothetical protein